MKARICVMGLVFAALLTTGCGKSFSGTYESIQKGALYSRLVFEPGHKVILNMGGVTTEATYEIDGNQFKYTIGGMTQVAEITEKEGHECINLNPIVGLLCKK
jgi:hypothetical protein